MTVEKFLDEVNKNIKKFLKNNYIHDFVEYKLTQVWFCKTIQNYKGLFILKNDESSDIAPWFIEVTYNGDKQELYLDFYKKAHKVIIIYENE